MTDEKFEPVLMAYAMGVPCECRWLNDDDDMRWYPISANAAPNFIRSFVATGNLLIRIKPTNEE